MSLEHAGVQIVHKPWGRYDVSPWAKAPPGEPIGELWFGRPGTSSPTEAKLLLKLIFTAEPLSIQVHPDDHFAHLIGLHNGKTEAWFILSAEPGAQVAIGLTERLSRRELHEAILDGSIAGIANWRDVVAGDIVFVPARTIHAIGAGLVVAEIQQRSDTTFRLFDYDRGRELHVDLAVACADREPSRAQAATVWLTDTRTLLISCPFFTLEDVHIPPNSRWELTVECETWVMIISGDALLGATRAGVGDAFSSCGSRTSITAGSSGVRVLVAYASARPARNLLRNLSSMADSHSPRLQETLMTQSADLLTLTKETLL